VNLAKGKLIALCLSIPLGISGCESEPVESINAPSLKLTGRVVDQANILSETSETKLTTKLEKLERTSGPQFVIATTDSLEGRDIASYSVDLGRSWAIGHQDRDDGVILLVAPNERKVRIAVGYGLEGSLNDPFCAKVIREDILPAFRNGELETGILVGADRLIAKMERIPTIDLNDNESLTQKKKKIAS